jgi:hypothetical protein
MPDLATKVLRRPLALLGVVLLSACVSSPPASAIPSAPASQAPTFAPPDLAGRIIFARSGGIYGDGTVFAANADGTNEHQLGGLGEGFSPWATRDGERVLFATLAPDNRVTTATINFDGSDKFVIPLAAGTLELASGPFSPDGTQIAFEGFDEEHPEVNGIYIGSADGTNLVQITHAGVPADWSPDGTQLLLFREREGGSSTGSLYTVNVDGSGEHQVTPYEVAVQGPMGYRWSPDGSRITFPTSDGELWVINTDGSGLARLFVDEKVSHVRRSVITPTWSPDGSQLMFGLSPSPSPFDPAPNGLYVIDADGTGLSLVIGGTNFKREPTWVP